MRKKRSIEGLGEWIGLSALVGLLTGASATVFLAAPRLVIYLDLPLTGREQAMMNFLKTTAIRMGIFGWLQKKGDSMSQERFYKNHLQREANE